MTDWVYKSPVVLIAHSMGGLIAKEVTSKSKSRMRRLIRGEGLQHGFDERQRACCISLQD